MFNTLNVVNPYNYLKLMGKCKLMLSQKDLAKENSHLWELIQFIYLVRYRFTFYI